MEILRQITASGRQLARLVTNMLTLLRAEDFRRTLKTNPVNLVELIQKVVDQVRPFLEARRLKLLTELDEDLGSFELDADKIAAVLINLITNAIKFTPDGGTIELVARPAPDQNVEILVQDRGVGLDPEALKHVFQPFFTAVRSQPPLVGRLRVQQARAGPGPLHRQELRRDARGNDCSRLPRGRRHADHGASASPGLRTRFTAGGARAAGSVARSMEMTRGEPDPRLTRRHWRKTAAFAFSRARKVTQGRETLMPTALIVEDEPEANKLLAMLVQLRGYQTESALDGAQAIEHLQKHVPDVVFLDLMLPDVDGYEICRSLKSSGSTSAVPVIIVTARITAENRMESFRAGADDFIPKPYMPDEIFEALEQAQIWKSEIQSSLISGEAWLDSRDEAKTLRSLARLRNAIRAWSGLDSETIDELNRTVKSLWSSAAEWGKRSRLDQVATLGYSVTEACLTLTVTDEAGWLERHRQLDAGPLAGLVREALFDEVDTEPNSRTIRLVKRFRPG